MKTKIKLSFILSILFLVLFALFTYMVMNVDVRPIGPNKSIVGFAGINGGIFGALGENKLMYILTEIIGYTAILMALGFGVIGVLQLIHRKSLAKVDYSIIALGGFYVAVGLFYVLFEILIINYRPVLIDGVLEASYPSSHTMLALCIMATAIIQFKERIHTPRTRTIVNTICVILMLLTVVGRLMSGVHWFTDIVGSILISGCLVSGYYAVINQIAYKKAMKEVQKEKFAQYYE